MFVFSTKEVNTVSSVILVSTLLTLTVRGKRSGECDVFILSSEVNKVFEVIQVTLTVREKRSC